jgi:hypothetical protein
MNIGARLLMVKQDIIELAHIDHFTVLLAPAFSLSWLTR